MIEKYFYRLINKILDSREKSVRELELRKLDKSKKDREAARKWMNHEMGKYLNKGHADISMANSLFIEIAKQLIFAASVFLAFTPVLLSKDVRDLINNDISIKILITTILVGLTVSIIFGLFQLYIEFQYFLKNSKFHYAQAKYFVPDVTAMEEYSRGVSAIEQLIEPNSTPWPLYLQAGLFILSIILMITMISILMFK